MKLNLIPSETNNFPICGILVKGNNPELWINSADYAGINPGNASFYSIQLPGFTGCLILGSSHSNYHVLGSTLKVQQATGSLVIPEFTDLSVRLTDKDENKLFNGKKYLFHPEAGLILLDTPIQLSTILKEQTWLEYDLIVPTGPVELPDEILFIGVKPEDPEELLKRIENEFGKGSISDLEQPLTIKEKLSLKTLQFLFNKKDPESRHKLKQEDYSPSLLGKLVFSILGLFGFVFGSIAAKLENAFQDLDSRNRSEINKLLELLKNNPEKALHFAIPINDSGGGRGIELPFTLSRIWENLGLASLFQSGNTGNTGYVSLKDKELAELKAGYRITARELERKGDYKKAAFVYLKLLKEYWEAARVLEAGQHYQEAATVYLKSIGNKYKAAECFEKGKMYTNAIDVYRELKDHEKVADLLSLMGKKEDSEKYYKMVIEEKILIKNYLEAYLIWKNKIGRPLDGKSLLIKGWIEICKPEDCLNEYLLLLPDNKEKLKYLESLTKTEMSSRLDSAWIKVLKTTGKQLNLEIETRDLAYTYIVTKHKSNPALLNFLGEFNSANRFFTRDLVRFKNK